MNFATKSFHKQKIFGNFKYNLKLVTLTQIGKHQKYIFFKTDGKKGNASSQQDVAKSFERSIHPWLPIARSQLHLGLVVKTERSINKRDTRAWRLERWTDGTKVFSSKRWILTRVLVYITDLWIRTQCCWFNIIKQSAVINKSIMFFYIVNINGISISSSGFTQLKDNPFMKKKVR